jgi:predicted YcjX-like family ATPase
LAIDTRLSRLTRRTVRIGVTGLARAGKTAFLTSTAANLLALGAGRPVLPALARRLKGRSIQVALAPSGAAGLPRFDHLRHMAALAQDPPAWPERTSAASMLALDIVLGRERLGFDLPAQRVRLEMLDYPGEWLLDLPLLRTSFSDWSAAVLRRLETPSAAPHAQEFMAFSSALPAGAPADEALAATGHRLYRAALHRLRDQAGLSLLQPGRFLMPAPGPEPGWTPFFPNLGSAGLQGLLARRYDAYVDTVQRDLNEPMFGNLDRIVVLVDLLTPLHAGAGAFADAAAAVAAAAGALRWRRSWIETAWALGRLQRPPRVVSRVAFGATKADHVADRQRGNLAALLRNVAGAGSGDGFGGAASVDTAYLPLAAVRCTEDFVWTLDGRPVSAVRGRRIGDDRMLRSYPGEVPDRAPDDAFWSHPFLQVPDFEPLRPPEAGRGGVPELGLDVLLSFLLDDIL